LAENKQLISVSFTALLRTLKSDSKIINLIYKIPAVNDGEKDKDNNNITNYLEFNRDRILDFAQKNYENLVETLTNISISSAVTSSNTTLSLPSSSSFSGSYNQNNTFRIEKTETFHNGKGDITD